MNSKKHLLLACTILFFGMRTHAQKFLPSFDRFAEKESFLVNKKGDTIKFILKDLDRKKGIIVNVEGKTLEGDKFEYKAEEILSMGLQPSGFSKYATTVENVTNLNRMEKTNMNELTKKYAIFFQEYLEDKKRTVLVQLLNPTFSSKIRVYDDPLAAKTGGIGVGGIQVTGGDDKSFYVKWNNKTFRMKKKEYDEYFDKFFGNCPAFKAKFPRAKWNDFEEHLYFFETQCN
jgi:hypothetical protein